VVERYQDWLDVKRPQAKAGDLSPRTVSEYERYGRRGGEISRKPRARDFIALAQALITRIDHMAEAAMAVT
jgi:hypothetical protein